MSAHSRRSGLGQVRYVRLLLSAWPQVRVLPLQPLRRSLRYRHEENVCLSCTKPDTDAAFTDILQQQREKTAKPVTGRQQAQTHRLGQSMNTGNI